ncbi:hypothetical protein AB0M44_43490 [Streptosporangium subroseum]|uniref:hypothetical protein n=1 Tax=Streptosporangium subroseum TaxID=106412 RepID=UPI00343988C5
MARVVLLMALALGVCGMYTLGHLDGWHVGHVSVTQAMGHTQAPFLPSKELAKAIETTQQAEVKELQKILDRL